MRSGGIRKPVIQHFPSLHDGRHAAPGRHHFRGLDESLREPDETALPFPSRRHVLRVLMPDFFVMPTGWNGTWNLKIRGNDNGHAVQGQKHRGPGHGSGFRRQDLASREHGGSVPTQRSIAHPRPFRTSPRNDIPAARAAAWNSRKFSRGKSHTQHHSRGIIRDLHRHDRSISVAGEGVPLHPAERDRTPAAPPMRHMAHPVRRHDAPDCREPGFAHLHRIPAVISRHDRDKPALPKDESMVSCL